MEQKTILKIFVSIISLVLVVILLSQVSIKDVISTILSINPFYLIAAFLFYFSTYIWRAVRFSLLLNNAISSWKLLPITCINIMTNNILPARTGELSYVYLLKKIHARTVGEGIATLLVARIFDFIVIIILLFVSRFNIENVPSTLIDIFWVIYLFLICLVIVLIAMVSIGHKFMEVVEKVLGYFHWDTSKLGKYVMQKGDETVKSFERIAVRKNAIEISILSVVTWLFTCITLYIILFGMGISLPFPNVIFGAAFISLTSVLPIYGVGGFGTTEAIWTLVFVPLGMTLDDAIISAFGYHLIILIYTIILGLVGFLLLKKNSVEILNQKERNDD